MPRFRTDQEIRPDKSEAVSRDQLFRAFAAAITQGIAAAGDIGEAVIVLKFELFSSLAATDLEPRTSFASATPASSSKHRLCWVQPRNNGTFTALMPKLPLASACDQA